MLSKRYIKNLVTMTTVDMVILGLWASNYCAKFQVKSINFLGDIRRESSRPPHTTRAVKCQKTLR